MPNLAQPQPTGKTKLEILDQAQAFASMNNFLPGDRIEPVVARIGGVIRYLDRRASDEAEDGSLIVRGQDDFEIFVSEHTERYCAAFVDDCDGTWLARPDFASDSQFSAKPKWHESILEEWAHVDAKHEADESTADSSEPAHA